jgi:hypothetical protein
MSREVQAMIHAYFNQGSMPEDPEEWTPQEPAGSTYWGPREDQGREEIGPAVEQPVPSGPAWWWY